MSLQKPSEQMADHRVHIAGDHTKDNAAADHRIYDKNDRGIKNDAGYNGNKAFISDINSGDLLMITDEQRNLILKTQDGKKIVLSYEDISSLLFRKNTSFFSVLLQAASHSHQQFIDSLCERVVQIADDNSIYEESLKTAFSQVSATQWLFPGKHDRADLFKQVMESVTDNPHPYLKEYTPEERLLLFIELLARTVPQLGIQQALRDWVDDFAASKNVPPEHVTQFRAYATKRPTPGYHMAIYIRELLTASFNETELRDLCFNMQIDYEALPGSGTADKAREFILFCQRHNRYKELVNICYKLRPNAFKIDSDYDQEKPSLPSQKCSARGSQLAPPDPMVAGAYPSLLIKINNHPHLLLEAWIWKSQQDIHRLETRAFEPEDLPDILSGLLDKSLPYITGESNLLSIEFFLPCEFYLRRDLFPHRLDNLMIDWGLDEQHLGTYYYVVLRSLERIEGKHKERLRDRWREKWGRFRDVCNGTATWSATLYGPVVTPTSIAGNYAQLDQYLLPNDVLGLALSHESFSQCNIEPQKLFRKMVQTGIPIAFWIEPDEDHYCLPLNQQTDAALDHLKQELEGIAVAQKLPALLTVVREQRQEARRQQSLQKLHIGAYLTLFWDDPDRIPEIADDDPFVEAAESV